MRHLRAIVDQLRGSRVLVVGDVMLDEYLKGDVSRICPETPVPVLEVKSHDYRLGGAANAAANIQTLGGAGSQAFAVNDALVVVGVSDRRVRPPVAFLWTPATGMRDAGFGSNSQALAINAKGRIAGLRVVDAGVLGLVRTLRTPVAVLPDVDAEKPPFSGPAGMNACGDLVGSSSSPDPTNGNPVPAIWTKAGCD